MRCDRFVISFWYASYGVFKRKTERVKCMTFESTVAYKMLHPYFQKRLHVHEALAQHDSFGAGGPADIWLELNTRQELTDLVKLCAQQDWPLLVVGAGSNILYADAGVRGIVASVALKEYHIEEQPDASALVVAEAGVRWNSLIEGLVARGWGGLEFGVGIPGTIGGGLVSNAGAHNQDLGQALEWIEVLDARGSFVEGKEPLVFPVVVIRRYPREALDLGYRHSRFREGRLTHVDAQGKLVVPKRGLIEPAELVVTLALRVHKQDAATAHAQIMNYAKERKQDDPAQRHCGSIFKNPRGTTADALIKQAGLAGKKQGNAQISERNANYIVNLGGATASDIAALIVEAHQQVLAKSGVNLAMNIELVGEW